MAEAAIVESGQEATAVDPAVDSNAPGAAPVAAPTPPKQALPADDAVLHELAGELWGQLAPLLPVPDICQPVTPDGSVLKQIITLGTGAKPPKFARCLVHYVGRLQSNGSVFIDTKSEAQGQQPTMVVAGRHTSPREAGLFQAVETMRVGERAAVYIQDSAYGYGASGSFSFPSVPPNEKLTYEVELVDFDSPTEEEVKESVDSRTGLLYEERLERAEARRLDGNKLFADSKYREALSKYLAALSYLDEEFMMQLEGFYEDKANEVKAPIHLNLAACQLRLRDFHTAIYNCGEVLKLQPDNVKALYRRGVARHALGQTEDALADLRHALDKSPGDQAVCKELAAVKATMRAEREAQAKLFKGAFGATPEPRAPPASAAAAPEPTPSGAGSSVKKLASRVQGGPAWTRARGGFASRIASLFAWLFSALLAMLGVLRRRKAVPTDTKQQ